MTAIGIDMSKSTFHAAFDDSTVRIFKNSEAGIDSFVAALSAEGITSDGTAIGVEATGAYHLQFCSRFRNLGWRIVVINPLETHHVMAVASLRKLKTDRKDALRIRTMAALGHGYLYTDTDDVFGLKTLVVEREGLVAMRTQTKGRMEAHAAKQRAITKPLHDSSARILAVLRKGIYGIERQFERYDPETQTLLRSIPGVGESLRLRRSSRLSATSTASHPPRSSWPISALIVGSLKAGRRSRERDTSASGATGICATCSSMPRLSRDAAILNSRPISRKNRGR
jgi:transposase